MSNTQTATQKNFPVSTIDSKLENLKKITSIQRYISDPNLKDQEIENINKSNPVNNPKLIIPGFEQTVDLNKSYNNEIYLIKNFILPIQITDLNSDEEKKKLVEFAKERIKTAFSFIRKSKKHSADLGEVNQQDYDKAEDSCVKWRLNVVDLCAELNEKELDYVKICILLLKGDLSYPDLLIKDNYIYVKYALKVTGNSELTSLTLRVIEKGVNDYKDNELLSLISCFKYESTGQAYNNYILNQNYKTTFYSS